ncbi:hypothetical protein BDR26DRAFT_860035 [Obelidium mucronatum]|nr:hypothetical protein BDR26DRAFT_860035 [Obelidium mucronatum]
MATQQFNFYEGSLASSAYIVPSAKNPHVSLSAASHTTLSDSMHPIQSLEEELNLEHDEYDSDFEQEQMSPPPKRVQTPHLPTSKLPNPSPRKQLHTFQGKMHPLILRDDEHCQIDPHVGDHRQKYVMMASVLTTQESKTSLGKKSASKQKSKKRSQDSASRRSLKQALPPLLPHQRKMESILHDIHHPQQTGSKRAASILIRPDIDQVSKLLAVIDDLKLKLKERDEEVKTLKIVNRRQDLAINRTDKNQQDLPKILQHQSEELRTLKHTHATCASRISNAEKSSQEHIEETVQLREKLAKMTALVKSRFGEEGASKVHVEIEKLKKDVDEKEELVVELNKKIKYLENSNNMAVREVRLKNAKLVKEVEDMKLANKQLSEKLEEKARQIAAMSIYSMLHSNNPHAPEPPQSENGGDAKTNSKRHQNGTQTTIRTNKAHLNPQQSVHKPTLAKPTSSNKPNNDALIKSWHLSKTPLPSNEDLLNLGSMPHVVSSEHVSEKQISKRLAILEQSEDTPVAIVARRYLLMQLAALEKLRRSPEAETVMPRPPKATQKPKIDDAKSGTRGEDKTVDELEFFTFPDTQRKSVLGTH